MADKDEFNDEYQFADLDVGDSPITEDEPANAEADTTTSESIAISNDNKKTMIKMGLIGIAALVVLIAIYKAMGSFSTSKKLATQTSVPTPIIQPAPITPSQVAPVTQPTTYPVAADLPPPSTDTKVSEKLSDLESTQQSMRTDVSSVSNQLSSLSKNVDALIAKMSELNTIIANLNTKVDEQARELEHFTIRREQAKKAQPRVVYKAINYPKYYIQAVIPGRAWLIATNGATLTVREGTVVAGYGMVKLIDPSQGRVVTSSGQVIRFSQNDS